MLLLKRFFHLPALRLFDELIEISSLALIVGLRLEGRKELIGILLDGFL